MTSRRRERGSTTAEFAMVATVFFVFVIGILEVAYLIFGMNAVTNGAREGARYGIASANGASACSSTSSGMLARVNASTPGLAGVTISASTGTTTFGTATDSWCQVTVSWSLPLLDGTLVLPKMTVTSTSRYYDNNDLT